MQTAIQLSKVSSTINQKKILEEITFDIKRGEVCGILGLNGAGKTSLLSLIVGLRKHAKGDITVLGEKLPATGASLRRRIGVVLQETALYEELTTYENLRFIASLFEIKDTKKRIEEILDLLMLKDRAGQTVGTLSGGLRRRVAIARALLHAPELLIIDEPTLGVDVEARHAIWSHLRMLKASGTTIVVATNYLDEVQALCDTVAVLRDGKLLAFETPERLLSRAGNCIDVECADEAKSSITRALDSEGEVLGIAPIPGGLTVFVRQEAAAKSLINRMMETVLVQGFRVRCPDLAEVFHALESST